MQAINECVDHFHRFASSEVRVTVAWHKCLLVLVQRYKGEYGGLVLAFYAQYVFVSVGQRFFSSECCVVCS